MELLATGDKKNDLSVPNPAYLPDDAAEPTSAIETRLREIVTCFNEGQKDCLVAFLKENESEVERTINARAGESQLTPMHDLCDAFSKFAKEANSATLELAATSCVDMLRVMLDHGADVNGVDSVGANVVHHAAKAINFPRVALEEIVAKSVDVTSTDSQGSNALHYAMNVEPNHLRSDRIELLIDAGCDLNAPNNDEKTPVDVMFDVGLKNATESFLALASRSNFGAVLDVIVAKAPSVIEKYANAFLWPAVLAGSLLTVQLLLDRGAKPDSTNYQIVADFPVTLAAGLSAKDADEKFALLLKEGYDPHELGAKGGNVGHAAAQQGNVDLLRRADDLKVDLKLVDSIGATALHKAARGGQKAIDALEYLIELGSDVGAKNDAGDTPLFLALVAKNEKGCAALIRTSSTVRVTTEQLSRLHYEQLRMLSNADPIVECRDPLLVSLQLSRALSKAALLGGAYKRDMESMACALEDLAIELLESCSAKASKNLITDDLLDYAIRAEMKKFVSSPLVQDYVEAIWQGSLHTGKTKSQAETIRDITLSMLLVIFLPCLAEELRFLHGNPVIAFTANFVSYALFMIVLIVSSVYNGEVNRTELTAIDWILLVFVIGYILQEATQFYHLYKKKKTMDYLQSVDNIADSVILLGFVIYFILMLIGYYASGVNSFEIVRASYYLFGFCALGCSIRILSYSRIHPVLGPVHMSFLGMIQLFITFLTMVLIFMLGFSLAIASIYSSILHSPNPPIGANYTVPSEIDGFAASFRTVFWTTLGGVSIDNFEASSNVETIFGSILFLIWSIISSRILLGLLFGLVFSKFYEIQANAETNWKFARTAIVLEFAEDPLMPVPFNIISLPFKPLCSYLGKSRFQRFGEEKMKADFRSKAIEEMVKKYKRQKEKSQKEESVSKKDLEVVDNKLTDLNAKIEILLKKLESQNRGVVNRVGKMFRGKKTGDSAATDLMTEELPIEEQESIDEADQDEYAETPQESQGVLGKVFGSVKGN